MAQLYARDQPKGFTNRIERVAIVGAGGQVGKFFAEELLKTGKHVVTAITRANSTAKLPAGAKAAIVDYNDEQSLVAALKGQQFLIITVSMAAPSDTQSKLIRAAAKAGVPYVMPNWYGADFANKELLRDCSLGPDRTNINSEIEALGVSSWIVMSCGFWYEFSLASGPDTYGIDIKHRSITWIDDGTTRINHSSWPQCGRALGALLSLKELPENENDKSPTVSQFRNSVFYTSSFKLSQKDMFDSVKRVTGTKDEDWTETRESSTSRWKDGAERLKKGEHSGFLRQLYSRVLFPNGGGDFEGTKGISNALLGLPKEDLDSLTKVAVRAVETNNFQY